MALVPQVLLQTVNITTVAALCKIAREVARVAYGHRVKFTELSVKSSTT
jgi:hypothetical protein